MSKATVASLEARLNALIVEVNDLRAQLAARPAKPFVKSNFAPLSAHPAYKAALEKLRKQNPSAHSFTRDEIVAALQS